MTALVLVVLTIIQLCYVRGELLHSASGDVGRGNFSYYSLMYNGFISLELVSMFGDCDLYVSQHFAKPTYEPHMYCLHSATCGGDVIVIPKSFQRPIGIGIYGYPAYETSTYLLLVHRIEGITELDEFTDELSLVPSVEARHNEDIIHDESQAKPGKHKDNLYSSIYVILYSLLDLLLDILFM